MSIVTKEEHLETKHMHLWKPHLMHDINILANLHVGGNLEGRNKLARYGLLKLWQLQFAFEGSSAPSS